MKLAYSLLGLIIASGILTYLTRNTKPVYTPIRHKKKRHKKVHLREDVQPYLTKDGVVVLGTKKDKQLLKEKYGFDEMFEEEITTVNEPVKQASSRPLA